MTNDAGSYEGLVTSGFSSVFTSKGADQTNLGLIGCLGGQSRDQSNRIPEYLSLPMLSQGMWFIKVKLNEKKCKKKCNKA